MKIAILTLGTRGDTQPFVALGLGLQQAGYEILFISAKNEAAFVSSFGLPYVALSADIQKAMEARDVQQMAKGDNPIAFVRSHLSGSKTLQQQMDVVQNEAWQACQGADAIIYHPGMANAYYMARQLGIPAIMASPFPVTPTRAYPAILFYDGPRLDGPRLGGWYNSLTHWVVRAYFLATVERSNDPVLEKAGQSRCSIGHTSLAFAGGKRGCPRSTATAPYCFLPMLIGPTMYT